mgnify:CR=1 FL=1
MLVLLRNPLFGMLTRSAIAAVRLRKHRAIDLAIRIFFQRVTDHDVAWNHEALEFSHECVAQMTFVEDCADRRSRRGEQAKQLIAEIVNDGGLSGKDMSIGQPRPPRWNRRGRRAR